MTDRAIQFKVDDEQYRVFKIYDDRLKAEGFGNSDKRRYDSFLKGALFLLGDIDSPPVSVPPADPPKSDGNTDGVKQSPSGEDDKSGSSGHILGLYRLFSMKKSGQRKA
ncbi:MAG: hypothetical protein AB7S75_03330 [Desulfococcaceae bacterium]